MRTWISDKMNILLHPLAVESLYCVVVKAGHNKIEICQINPIVNFGANRKTITFQCQESTKSPLSFPVPSSSSYFGLDASI